MSNIQSGNYTLGRGELHYAQFASGTKNPTGFRYFGNTPSFGITANATSLDHYNADHGIKVKDESITLQVDYTGALTADDIQLENLAIMFLGSSATTSQVSATGVSETFSGAAPGLTYQLGMTATNPSGVKSVLNVVLTHGVTPLKAGTDYTLDAERGQFKLLRTAATTVAHLDITAKYDLDKVSVDGVISGQSSTEGSLLFKAYNPAGAQIDFFMPFVRLSPTGDFALKGDTWQTLNLKADILVQADKAAIYANGAPYKAA